MTEYEKWIARGTAVCDAECAQAMGWERSGRWWTEDGVTMAPAEDVVLALAWSPTVNRNDTARMVHATTVLNGRTERFIAIFKLAYSAIVGGSPELVTGWHTWQADPSLLAYCACKAMKEET